jgi:CDP-glycerol glycerophosphotransferase
MPALSVVLVVHREQAYIEQCLRSVLADDVQVVVIDDASPDHAPRILDEFEGLHVRHLDQRIGINAARNLALDEVTSDYVWFVETTDHLKPGALPRVLDAISSDRPDVLVVGHERSGSLGETKPGRTPVLHDLGRLAPEPWNKVFRRDALAGLSFGDGMHGELRVTWPLLLRTQEVALLPEVMYHRHRPGNAVRHGSALDVIAHYDAVVSEGPELVLPAMVEHELRLLQGLKGDRRAEFLAAMVRQLEHVEGPLPGDGVARLRTELIARGAGGPLEVLDRALAVRAGVARRQRALKRRGRGVQKAVERRRTASFYAARRREPVDPDLGVFAAYWYRGYSCNPRAIYERASELVPGFHGVWVVKPDRIDTLPPGIEYVVPGTREYWDVLARGRYFVNNVNFPNHLVKRPGSVHLMTHHGTPLKTMGLDLRNAAIAGQRMDFPALVRRSRRWDFSVSSNPLSTLVWERVFPVAAETLEVGYPRNDVLANATGDDVRRVRGELGIQPGQTAVLYAPTHREYQVGYQPTMDLAAVADGLGDDHVVLARLHYFYGQDPHLRDLGQAGRVVDVADHPSIEELCLAADVLVTDYSSLMFDYAVLDRPIVIHAPDWDVYRAVRGTYFDLMEQRPGVVARTDDEVVDALRSGAAAGDEARRDRAAFRARFCPWDDGHAAERVVRRVWLGESVPAPEPALAVAE